MPIDEVVEAAGLIARVAIGTAELAVGTAELVNSPIFRGRVARYFHGIGRRVIAVVTFGRKSIASSLRVVPNGVKPKPRAADWTALWVGIGIWVVGIGLAIVALINW